MGVAASHSIGPIPKLFKKNPVYGIIGGKLSGGETMKAKILWTKFLMYTSITLGVFTVLVALLLGDSRDPVYFWAALVAIPFFCISIFLFFHLGSLMKLKQIQEQWGKVTSRKRNFDDIGHYFHSNKTGEDKTHIDDSTWNDLNMNELFSLIDRTITSPGESALYNILRTPCSQDSAQELIHRNKIITTLQENPETREKLQLALLKMGRDQSNTITHLLWDPLPPKNPLSFVYSLLALVALLALFTPLLLGSQSILLIMGVFAINSIVHYRVRKKFSYHLPSITSLSGLLRSTKNIIRADFPEFDLEQQQLKDASISIHKITSKLSNLFFDTNPSSDIFFFIQYIQIFLLMEVRSFYGALEEIKRQIKELREIYRIVGLLDALQATASYRKGLDYIEPVFTQDRRLDVVELRHPLLANPSPNSICIQEKGILVTGSNMAGKSTFLRTLGINVIMAQSIYTCLADSYTASYLQVASSINKADNISQHKSLYYAEAERLLNIIQPEYSKFPALCLIDELLSGTNYTERLSASEAILNYLKKKNALIVIATHDLDLAESLEDTYQCYHFSDKVDNNHLQFDYKLKHGIATTRNAIKLLEYLGYPKDIIQEANKQVK